MACFLVSAASAVAVTAAGKAVQHNEEAKLSTDHAVAEAEKTQEKNIPFSRKLMWLEYMLWGGAFLLMFEHLCHCEVFPWFPFLTNASNSADAAEMLHEMATTGVCMALLIVAVWAGIVAATHFISKRDTAKENA